MDWRVVKGDANLTYTWTVNGVAVTKQIAPDTLTLQRAEGNGPMVVTLAMSTRVRLRLTTSLHHAQR